MKKIFSILTIALMSSSAFAAYTLNNPVGDDGRYIVKWDNEKGQFAAANDMQLDETFTFAVDVTGTWLETFLAGEPTAEGATRGLAINKWTSRGDVNGDTNRMKRIKGNIWGMDVNYAQIATSDFSEALMPDSMLYVYAQIFGFEFTPEEPGAGWWMWGENPVDITKAPGSPDDALFAFGPYVPGKQSADLYVADWNEIYELGFLDVNPAIYGYEVKGYAAPGVVLGTPVFMRDDLSSENPYLWLSMNEGAEMTNMSPVLFATNGDFKYYYFEVDAIGGEYNIYFTDDAGLDNSENPLTVLAGAPYFMNVVSDTEVEEDDEILEMMPAIDQWQLYTDLGEVEATQVKSEKAIENGQLVIIRNGVKYNALGAQL